MKLKIFTTVIFMFLLFSVLTGKVYASEVTEKFTGQEQGWGGLYKSA